MKIEKRKARATAGRTGLMLIAGWLLATGQASAAGTWSKLANKPNGPVNLMLLLSDGTIMAANNPGGNTFGNAWYRLTPDAHGSYVNGTWTTLKSMSYTRLFYSSAVLRDGRVFVAGGEYGTGTNTAELYDPGADVWSTTASAGQNFLDSSSKLLPNGNILVSPVGPSTANATVIYNPGANSWSSAGASLAFQAEASWVKLPDDSVLTVDPDSISTERYIPSLNLWIQDQAAPTSLYVALAGYVGEIGPAILQPDGKALFLGGTSRTAIYTPTGNTNLGTWAQGPNLPASRSAADSSAAMMANGRVLCALASPPYVDGQGNVQFPKPTYFYEYDPAALSFAQVNAPNGTTSDNVSCFQTFMLDLPDGNVLYSDYSDQLYVYQPGGTPTAAGKPTIYDITWNENGTLHLTGTLFNGISAGAAYGDDAQMDSNYPLVRLTDGGGNVIYGTTFNWSSTGVRTGGNVVSTECSLPWLALGQGPYSLVVVANGISSDPVTFYGPVWVNFNFPGFLQNGSFLLPYSQFTPAVNAVLSGGTIAMFTTGSSPEALTINKPMTIHSVSGINSIGH